MPLVCSSTLYHHTNRALTPLFSSPRPSSQTDSVICSPGMHDQIACYGGTYVCQTRQPQGCVAALEDLARSQDHQEPLSCASHRVEARDWLLILHFPFPFPFLSCTHSHIHTHEVECHHLTPFPPLASAITPNMRQYNTNSFLHPYFLSNLSVPLSPASCAALGTSLSLSLVCSCVLGL